MAHRLRAATRAAQPRDELAPSHSSLSKGCGSLVNLDVGSFDNIRVGCNLPFHKGVKFSRGQDHWLDAKGREFIR